MNHQIGERRMKDIWRGMKRRCFNKNCARYKDYGGRGITMCDEWLDYEVWKAWALTHGYTDELTIERIDNDGNYCPENCTWITRREQRRNNRQLIKVEYKGKIWILKDLCKAYGLHYSRTHQRIKYRGWSVERAVEEKSLQKDSLMSKCAKAGLNYGTVHDRIVKLGWTEEEALNTPCNGRGTSYVNPRKISNRICKRCGKEYVARVGSQKYCCADCREKDKKERRRVSFRANLSI